MWSDLLHNIRSGSIPALARSISLVENGKEGYQALLENLPESSAKITGITGPPGAGKSTITDALIGEMVAAGETVAVLCIDPSSPFHHGALLGDRVRMSEWYNHPSVFIRSLATRGSLGGLHPRIIEISDLLKTAGFSQVIIETVGVGQSEVEIAGLADTTVVVVVPEAGDEIQTMKAGLMEIADIFVVNKSDRPDADHFVRNLRMMLAPAFQRTSAEIPILKTIASQKTGIGELYAQIRLHHQTSVKTGWLFAEKAYQLIQESRMKDISRETLKKAWETSGEKNLYRFVQPYLKNFPVNKGE